MSCVSSALPILLSLPLLAACEARAPMAAQRLHHEALVLDTHADTTQLLMQPGFDFTARHAFGHVDLPRMREGGLDALFFSIWLSGEVKGAPAVVRALAQIDRVRELVRAHPDELVLCTSAGDVRRAHAEGRIAALIGVEGGHMIGADLAVLRTFHALGVRYLTLTHSKNVEWADSSGDEALHHGLSDFGREVVAEMNRLGMLVDVSHVSDETFWDVLETSRAPLIASHSSARALVDAKRNMSDDMLRALAERGGVVQVNFYTGFISQALRDAMAASPQLMDEQDAEVLRRCGDDELCASAEHERLTAEKIAAGLLPRVGWERIVDHIDHIAGLVGAGHVGLGSDFDGAPMPAGMEDAARLPRLTAALLQRGYSEREVRAILGGNTLRLMEQVEAVARGFARGRQR